MGKVAVTAWTKAKPGHEARLNEISATLQRETLAHEPGCLSYLLCQSHDGPAQLVFFETWASPDALDAHIGAPHTKVWFDGTTDTTLAPSAITKLVILSERMNDGAG